MLPAAYRTIASTAGNVSDQPHVNFKTARDNAYWSAELFDKIELFETPAGPTRDWKQPAKLLVQYVRTDGVVVQTTYEEPEPELVYSRSARKFVPVT